MRVFNKLMDFIEYYAIGKNDEMLTIVVLWSAIGLLFHILCKLIISI